MESNKNLQDSVKSKCLLSNSHIRVFQIQIVVSVNTRGSSALKNLSALQYISQLELQKVVEAEERATWIGCTSEPVKLVKADQSRSRNEGSDGSVDQVHYRREYKRLQSTAAWQRWKEDPSNLEEREVKQLYRIDVYTSGRGQEQKVVRLQEMFSQNPEISKFLECAKSVLNQSK